MTSSPVDRFAAAIEGATISATEIFASNAVLDATVPNWRFTVRGGARIADTFAHWFADPGHFEELRRTPLPDGELLEFALTWTEHGVPHMCHQLHRLEVDGDRIVRDTAFCGGRWPASLMAEMAAENDDE